MRKVRTSTHLVFWGTHGCNRRKGHANACRCFCGVWLPTGHKHVFGLDASTAVFDPRFEI